MSIWNWHWNSFEKKRLEKDTEEVLLKKIAYLVEEKDELNKQLLSKINLLQDFDVWNKKHEFACKSCRYNAGNKICAKHARELCHDFETK